MQRHTPNVAAAIGYKALATPLRVVLLEIVLAVLGRAMIRERSTQEEDPTFSNEGKPTSLLVPAGMRSGLIRKNLTNICARAYAVLRLLSTGFGR